MPRRRTVTTKPRYAYATQRAYEVLAHMGVDCLPVDPLAVKGFYPEIYIEAYTVLRDETGVKDPFFFDERNKRNEFMEKLLKSGKSYRIDGETRKKRGSADYMVVYDDRIESKGRIRWTLAHELGHIFLGHFTQFDITDFVRGENGKDSVCGLTDEEYEVLEVEAHCFAAAFLSPAVVVKQISALKTEQGVETLQDICGLSEASAIIRLGQLKELPYESYRTDAVLRRNFYKFVHRTNTPEFTLHTAGLSGLPPIYDDYVEYDYWHYAIDCIARREKNIDLTKALQNSIAVYDGADMLIITDKETNKALADRHKEPILQALKKYCEASVRSISATSAEALGLLS